MSKFSHDSDLANFLWSSGLLNKACNAICNTPVSLDDQDLPFSISIEVVETLELKIIVFRSSPHFNVKNLEKKAELVSCSNDNLFEFISPKVNPCISINKTALDIFASLFEDHLSKLQDEITISKPLLVTGNSFGGSIASLFTLYLLDTTYNTKTLTRPICITFGSPLLGDAKLQKAIYQKTSWPSCFVHVTLSRDPIPMRFCSLKYEPFGLYLFYSESGCACIDRPESVKEIMVALRSIENFSHTDIQIRRYSSALLAEKNIKGMSELVDRKVDSLELGIITELQAIGVLQTTGEVENEKRSLIEKIKKTKENGIIRKRNVMDEKKKLNEIKIYMNDLEWYKKATLNDGGYYDGYKMPDSYNKRLSKVKIKVNKIRLEMYWTNMVGKAKQMPQKEAISFRNSWLYGGTHYRRMVEPLHIAAHYLSGKTDYKTARPEHFILLEKWFNDGKKPEKQTTPASLTEDSCFWAHVEEAVLSFKLLKSPQSSDDMKDSAMTKLKNFENYVMHLVTNYLVSPEIFLPNSTFMRWWGGYKRFKDGTARGGMYTSPFANFMMNERQRYV